MVTTAMGARRGRRHEFYVGMAAVFVLIAFGGFVPTYWAKLAAGDFHAAPIVHIHGALFFVWTLFFFAQTALVAAGRTMDHRSWGLAGISLATAMGISVVLATINSIRTAAPAGLETRAEAFAIVPLLALVVFAGFFAAAIATVRRPEIHKRLMIMTMIPLAHAAIFRLYMVSLAPPGPPGTPPPSAGVPPGIVADLLILAAIAFDWRSRGRAHPVYLIGGPIMLAEELACSASGGSETWLGIARFVSSLAG